MKSPLGLFAAGITAALVATPAAAADFTGPRAEVTVGLDRIKFKLDDYGVDDSIKAKGLTYGGAVGYDVPVGGSLVAGVEADVNFSTADRDFTDGVDSASFDAKRDLGLAARLGGRIAPRTLVYGKAGYTNLRIGAKATVGGVSSSDSANLDGYRLGLGLEQGFSRNAYLKAEYRYSNYEKDVTKNEVLTGVGLRF